MDLEKVEALFAEICGAYPAVVADPTPAIKVNEVKASAVVFVVRPWVKTEVY